MSGFPSMMMGAGGVRVSLNDQTVLKSGGPGTVTATFTVDNDGNSYKNSGTLLEQWLKAGAAAGYEVKVHVVSGALTTGTVDTWLACSADHSWTLDALAGNSEACVVEVKLRDAVSHTELDVAAVSISSHSSG